MTQHVTTTDQAASHTSSYVVAQTPAQVFAAILDVSSWWTGEIDGTAAAVGDEFTYRHPPQHHSVQRVVELVPERRVVWRVVDSHLSFTLEPGEWTGTEIVFDLAPASDGAGTEVRFTHVGLVPTVECYDACSTAWRHYVDASLRAFITTGSGLPDPWNDESHPDEEDSMEHGRIERRLQIDASPEVVYEVISSPEHLREWWPDEADLDPTPGATGTIAFGDPQADGKVEPLTVLEADPPRRFVFRWAYDGEVATDTNSFLVTFDLRPVAGGTEVHFVETGFRERGWEGAVLEEAYLDHVRGWNLFLPRLVSHASAMVARR